MTGPAGDISLVLRLNPEMQPIGPVQDLILGFHRVISVPFQLPLLPFYHVAIFLLPPERLIKKLAWWSHNSIDQRSLDPMVCNLVRYRRESQMVSELCCCKKLRNEEEKMPTRKNPQFCSADRSFAASSSAPTSSDANSRRRSMFGTGSGISAPTNSSPPRRSFSGSKYRLGGSGTVTATSCTMLRILHDSSAIGFLGDFPHFLWADLICSVLLAVLLTS